jgi:PAS domain S-box-containing protein
LPASLGYRNGARSRAPYLNLGLTVQENLAIWKKALAATSSGVLITDPSLPDNPIVYANAGFERMTGYSAAEVMGRNCRFLQGEGTEASAVEALRRAVAARDECRITLLNYRKDGTAFLNDLSIVPVWENERLTHFIGIQTDVSDRARATVTQEALDFAQTIFSTLREALLILTPDLRVAQANRSFYRLFQSTPGETEGRLVYELGNKQWDIAALRILLERILPSRNPFDDFEVEQEFPRIGRRTMLLNARRLEREGEPELIMLAIEDVTQRRAHREALRQSEDRYSLIVSGVKDYAIMMLDNGGRVVSWNPGAERLFGYREAEIIGRSYEAFYLEEDRRAHVPELELQQAATQGRASDDRWLVRRDGTPFWASGMTAALRDPEGNLRGFAKLVRDLTERKRLEEALWQRAADLAARDRAKDEFLAMLSHELRNPLNALTNAVFIARRRPCDDPTLARSLEIAERQIDHIGRLVNDLLDVARITKGKIELHRKPVALERIVRAAVHSFDAEARDRGITLLVDCGEAAMIDADALRIEQVLQNLLQNALRYTAQGTVAVSLAREGAHAVVRVRDTGIGIAPDLLPHVFDLFRQGERTLARTEGGLGIGLTIVKQIVTLHGGAVEATSEGSGKGTTVTVRLPALDEQVGTDTDAAPRLAPPEPALGRRALVVDDNADGADSLVMLLQLFGFDARAAYDGADAVGAAREYRPEIVFLDIGLPGKDGYAIATEMRADPQLAGLTLVAVTGYGRDADRDRARRAGFHAHLLKPVDFDVLHELLLGRARAGGERAT